MRRRQNLPPSNFQLCKPPQMSNGDSTVWSSDCKARWRLKFAKPKVSLPICGRQFHANQSPRLSVLLRRATIARKSISLCLILLLTGGCGTARSIPVVEAQTIPVKPVAAMTACQGPLLLDQGIEALNLTNDMPEWIELTLLNHAENARRAALCRLNHQALVQWIEVLP